MQERMLKFPFTVQSNSKVIRQVSLLVQKHFQSIQVDCSVNRAGKVKITFVPEPLGEPRRLGNRVSNVGVWNATRRGQCAVEDL